VSQELPIPTGGGTTARPSVRGLLHLWQVRGLRRLVFVRVLSSFGDGAFQGALAVLVLFSPERQTEPSEIALGFVVLLLPYSIIGPFAGALLDRWSRRRVIVWANVIRCVLVGIVAIQIVSRLPSAVLFITALLIMGVGRFVGSGLSASLPHTVAQDSLVGANALATTAGAVATAVGGGYAIVLRGMLGEASSRIAAITASVLLFYLLAALIASRFKLMALGPDETDEPAQPLRAVLQGFASGLHHILQRPTVGLAVLVVMIVRFCFGMCTLIVLLLFQKYFTQSAGVLRPGAAGIAEVLAVGAIGVFSGAVVTAPMVRKIGRTRYLVILLTTSAVIGVAFASQFTIWSTMVTTFVVGFAYQSSKVCMDSVVQADSDDAYVGRVFALYDTANNLCYVGAFALGVLLVPANGKGVGAVFLIGALFLVAGIGYGLAMARLTRQHAATGQALTPSEQFDAAEGHPIVDVQADPVPAGEVPSSSSVTPPADIPIPPGDARQSG
jgi:MFS family permease